MANFIKSSKALGLSVYIVYRHAELFNALTISLLKIVKLVRHNLLRTVLCCSDTIQFEKCW